jgi:uncharacterized phiE125 gp8 family phage protein
MLSELVTITPPAADLSLSFVKSYLRVDYTDDDVLITSLIQSARERAQIYYNRSFTTQTLQAYYDAIERRFALPRAPIQSVVSVTLTYLNETSTLTLNKDYYLMGAQDKFVVLVATTYNLPAGFSVADDLYRFNLQVQYTAGYDTDYPCNLPGSKVPSGIQEAILKMVAAAYDMRADVQPTSRQGTIGFMEIPNDAKSLLNRYRVLAL